MTCPRRRRLAAILFAGLAAATAQAATPAQLLSGSTAQGAVASPARGQQFFTTTVAANCGACHTHQGDYDEHRIRIPR